MSKDFVLGSINFGPVQREAEKIGYKLKMDGLTLASKQDEEMESLKNKNKELQTQVAGLREIVTKRIYTMRKAFRLLGEEGYNDSVMGPQRKMIEEFEYFLASPAPEALKPLDKSDPSLHFQRAPEERKLSDSEIIRLALEAGFMISTHYGQEKGKLMPVSDAQTIHKFYELLTTPASEVSEIEFPKSLFGIEISEWNKIRIKAMAKGYDSPLSYLKILEASGVEEKEE